MPLDVLGVIRNLYKYDSHILTLVFFHLVAIFLVEERLSVLMELWDEFVVLRPVVLTGKTKLGIIAIEF